MDPAIIAGPRLWRQRLMLIVGQAGSGSAILSKQDQLWLRVGIAPDDSVLLELSTDLAGIFER